MKRCTWVNENNKLYIDYHDEEWGVPVHDDQILFEFIVLEGAQAGLSWETILKRREGYRKAFKGFDPHKVARFSEKDVERLMSDSGIIRNKLKITSTITNAKIFLQLQKEFGSFSNYLWSWTNNKQIVNKWRSGSLIPVFDDVALKISKDLKKRGFKFFGPTIAYAFMQAVGMVNDHTTDCFRYRGV